jgi:signal transduction histidine kinase
MSLDAGADRLGTVIRANVVLTIAAGGFTLATSLTVARLGWLTVAGIAVLATALPQALALQRLRSGQVGDSLLIYSLSSWTIAIVSSGIVTFQWPIQVAVAFMPVVLAATFVPERRIAGYVVASTVVALAVATIGLAQDATGLSDEIPEWLRNTVQAIVFPGFCALVVFAIVQHHRRVREVLAVEKAAQALAEERAADLAASRSRLVRATDRARQKIERDLHDGAQAHLVGIDLQLTRAMTLSDLESTRAALRAAQHELHRAHRELRELAHGLFPPVLSQHGLIAALADAADRFPVRIRLDLARIGRAAPDVEAAVYFCVLEALQNAAKHSRCDAVTITAEAPAESGVLQVSVVDDGCGVPLPLPSGQGLDNMRDRLGAIGGTVDVGRSNEGGTAVVARAPWI